jgi:hypothetical protein
VAAFDDVILFAATNYAPIRGLPYGHRANERNADLLLVFPLPSQYQEACEAVIRHADWIVFDRRGTDPAELKYNYPMMWDPQPPDTVRSSRPLTVASNLWRGTEYLSCTAAGTAFTIQFALAWRGRHLRQRDGVVSSSDS